MNEYLILQKELELEEMKYVNESTLYNELYGNYITESEGGNNTNFITRTFEAVREFIKKIKDKLTDFFTRSKKEEIKEMISSIENNEDLMNTKVKIHDYDKLEKLQKDTMGKLKKAKSNEAIKNIKQFYEKNKTRILAVASVATIGYVIHTAQKELDSVADEMDNLTKRSADAVSALVDQNIEVMGAKFKIQDQAEAMATILKEQSSTLSQKLMSHLQIIKKEVDGLNLHLIDED